jgi:lipopolysaccharide transport system ATP-binding protein
MPSSATSDPVEPPGITLRGVGVHYRLPRNRVRSLKEFSLLWLKRRIVFDHFWALSDVDLEVAPGERLGIVGRNGAGKSTLLQVMARIITPATGTVEVRGRVAPLLQLGAGFDGELTGRENIWLNGALLGMTRTEITTLFDAIVDFAELWDFIEAPLRTYSSGMAARLGFAMATAIPPDILLLDEVLSVGDEAFQAKCLERMRDFAARGTTMVLVSHDADLLSRESTRAIWLDAGRICADGEPHEVVALYRDSLRPPAPVPVLQE